MRFFLLPSLRRVLVLALALGLFYPTTLLAQQRSAESLDAQAREEQGLEAPSVRSPQGELALSPGSRTVAPGTYTLRGSGLDDVLFVPESGDDRVILLDAATGDVLDPLFISDSDNLSTPILVTMNFDGDGLFVSDQLNDGVFEYDLEGNFVGRFAPAGGPNTDILDNVRGFAFSPDGTQLWVTVASGANDGAIAAFDVDGNYVGNFIEPGTGGLDSPYSIFVRESDVLISDSGTDSVLRFDLDGMFLGTWNSNPDLNFPQQISEAVFEGEGDLLVAGFSLPSGIYEYASDGTLEDTYDVITGNRGVYELPNGNLLTTNGGGISEVTRDNVLVRTIASGSARFVGVGSLGGDATASVLFDDQTSDGLSVVVASASLPADGYVTIHDATLLDGDALGSVVGVSEFLTAGSYTDLAVTLFDVPGLDVPPDTMLMEDQTLIAMPHQETSGNMEYNFLTSGGSDDIPFFVDNDPQQGPVTDDAFVTILSTDGISFSPSPLVEMLSAGETGTETVTITNNSDGEVTFDFTQYSGDGAQATDQPEIPAGLLSGRELDLDKYDTDPRSYSHSPLRGAGGPDAFGYEWIDSNEPGGPAFEAIDISDTGTPLALTVSPGCDAFPADDEGFAEVELPFSFSFYGESYSSIFISANAFATFDGQIFQDDCTFTEDPIPTADPPNALIAPIWEDWNGEEVEGGQILTETLPDGRFVIQYDDWPLFFETSVNTFQVILSPSGAIKYQYVDMNNEGGDQFSIGVENQDGSIGLQVAYDEVYPVSGLAVLIQARPSFVTGVSPATGTIPAGGSADVNVDFSAEGLIGGTYEGALDVETNLSDPSGFELPVVLEVTGMAACAITAETITFEDTIIGTSSSEEATVMNGGTDSCELTDASADGPFSVENFTAGTLAPGESATFAVAYTPTEAGDDTGTLTVTLADKDDLTASLEGSALDAPTPEVDPASLSITVEQGETTSASLTLSNVGGEDAADLDYEISVMEALLATRAAQETFVSGARSGSVLRGGASAHERIVPKTLPQGPFAQTAEAGSGGDIVQDGSFEEGTPNPFWTEGSVAFGTPLCTVTDCGMGGGTGPFDGDWWAWFGGTAAGDEGFVEQDLVIPSGTASLSFYLEIPVAVAAPGFMNVLIDGEEVFSVTEVDQPAYATYQEVVIDVSDYADGGTHTLRFESTTSSDGNFFVDLVSIVSTGPALLSVSPESGSIAPGESEEIAVTVNATEVDLGTYEFNLAIATNDPSNPTITVPVTVEVIPPVANEGDGVPAAFALGQNYPNPFASRTTIDYALPEAARVTITVYDAVGRQVAVLVDEDATAGYHTADWDTRGLASGVYLYRIQAGDYTKTRKMSIVR